jgi:hypothetical protein
MESDPNFANFDGTGRGRSLVMTLHRKVLDGDCPVAYPGVSNPHQEPLP